MKPFIRNPYNYDTNKAGDDSGLDCSNSPSLTKQSFVNECDINTIVRRFNVTGELPQGIRMPSYGDFSQVNDFQTAMNAIAQAREAFDAMPADIRTQFRNDPAEFVDFCSKEENREAAVRMGLVPPKLETVDKTIKPDAENAPDPAAKK